MRLTSPAGSPSQTSARRPARPARPWRSRQFTDALILPPTNHFALGGFQSRTWVQGLIPSSCFAQSAPYPSGSRRPFSYGVVSWTWALALKPSGGGKRRCSSRRVSIRSVGVMARDIKEEGDSSKLHRAARYAATDGGEQAHVFRTTACESAC